MSVRLARIACLASASFVFAASAQPAEGIFFIGANDGRFVCRPGTHEQAARIRRPAPDTLRTIPDGVRVHSGLRIVLKGTTQLNAFPAAKAAFERAAAIWEAKIADPVTVTVSVDFGPTLFGDSWLPGELGATIAEDRESAYDAYRKALVAHADTPEESALYAALPKTSSLPTTLGARSLASASSAQLRALEMLPATSSDSDALLGLNSSFPFDFDPSNGVDANSVDFETVAVHELGHVLGFISNSGYLEDGYSPSIMDFFRFRPAITMATFETTPRVLSDGGEQVLFGAGGTKTAMSTGIGGDGEDSSHWKGNLDIGVMRPAFGNGEQAAITSADLDAFDLLGWTINRTTSTCTPSSSAACLLSNRFRVLVNYRNPFSTPPGATGDFLVRRLNPAGSNPDVATFGFNDANAVEVVVRIQDTRPFAPRFDIYYGGMTDVEYWVNVTDTVTGTTRQYHNAAGNVGGGLDRATFPAN